MHICQKIGESYSLITADECMNCEIKECPIFMILERVKKVELVQRARAIKKKKGYF